MFTRTGFFNKIKIIKFQPLVNKLLGPFQAGPSFHDLTHRRHQGFCSQEFLFVFAFQWFSSVYLGEDLFVCVLQIQSLLRFIELVGSVDKRFSSNFGRFLPLFLQISFMLLFPLLPPGLPFAGIWCARWVLSLVHFMIFFFLSVLDLREFILICIQMPWFCLLPSWICCWAPRGNF